METIIAASIAALVAIMVFSLGEYLRSRAARTQMLIAKMECFFDAIHELVEATSIHPQSHENDYQGLELSAKYTEKGDLIGEKLREGGKYPALYFERSSGAYEKLRESAHLVQKHCYDNSNLKVLLFERNVKETKDCIKAMYVLQGVLIDEKDIFTERLGYKTWRDWGLHNTSH